MGRRESGAHQLAVILDREHLAAVREARNTAETGITAACDLLGPAGETSVFVPARTAAKGGAQVTLIYNTLARTISPEERDRIVSNLASHGVVLEAHADLHAKFMTWDEDAIVITSFNWLATTPDPWKPRGAEIGVVVKGPNLVSAVRDRFRELTGRTLVREREVASHLLPIP
jgi:hypothetical protein